MKGNTIEIQLHTPILIPSTLEDAPAGKNETVVRVLGVVAQNSDAGILIDITEFLGERGQKIPHPGPSIFLPHHKIDHFFIRD